MNTSRIEGYLADFSSDSSAKDKTGLTHSSVTIGHDVDTGELITIGDTERCGGMYLVGEPRTGKSNLLISLALEDIDHGHSLLFIDPHTDAINDLLARIPQERWQDVILLDPTNKTHSFGINLLRCSDPTDLLELDNACGRAKDIFVKIWGDEQGRLGLWLEKILSNSIYLLLENPGYTLVEIPLLLSEDTRVRNSLLENVKVNPYVKEFWYYEFDRLSKQDRTKQVDPTLSRLNIFRRNTIIRHIVGQQKTTIDFYEILNRGNKQKIVLLRMPTQLDSEVRSLIGAMILSEMLYAAFERDKILKKDRRYFALYCDEFQNFATPDFAKLFTQTGKFKIMPMVAHQERMGQFKPDDSNRGATLAAPIKIFFRLSVHDSSELAPVVAKTPPTETKREQELVISQDPVTYLLQRGHKNSDIREFVNRVLRPAVEQREDIKEDMEYEKLIRDQFRDMAGIKRIDAQIEGLPYDWGRRNYDAVEGALEAAWRLQRGALEQSSKILTLFIRSRGLRQTERVLNHFLTAVMEGRVARGQKDYSQFLIDLVQSSSLVPQEYMRVLELYIFLLYGDPKEPRTIPFAFAQAHGILTQAVTKLQQDAEENLKREKEEFVKRERENYREKCRKWLADKKEEKQKRTEAVLKDLRELSEWRIWDLVGGGGRYFLEHNILSMLKVYILLLEYPDVEEVLKPYYTAKFAPPWQGKLPKFSEAMPYISDYLQRDKRENAKAVEFIRRWNSWIWRWSEQEPHEFYFSDTRFKDSLLNAFQNFLERLWEGALVVYILLQTTHKWFSYKIHSKLKDDMQYPGYNMLYLPTIEYREPLEIALTLERLSELVDSSNNNNLYKKEVNYTKYYWRVDGKKDFKIYAPRDDGLIIYPSIGGTIYKELEAMHGQTMRGDLQLLRKEAEKDVGRHDLYELARSACGFYSRHNQLVINYLQCRACDIVRYGEKVANLTFPQPTLPGVTTKRVVDAVNWMVSLLLQELPYRNEEEEYKKMIARMDKEVQYNLDKKFSKQIIPVQEYLSPRVLREDEIKSLKKACLEEISGCNPGKWDGQYMLAEIEYYVKIFSLLNQPENHIKVYSGQYVEKQVNSRQVVDMENEMAQELMKLNPGIAYARLIQNKEGKQTVVTRKIKTRQAQNIDNIDALCEKARDVIWESNKDEGCYIERTKIEGEIRQRYERLTSVAGERPPPTSY